METNSVTSGSIQSFLQKNVKSMRFLVKIGALLVLWKLAFFFIWRSPDLLHAYNEFSLFVIDLLLHASGGIMSFFGEEIELDNALRIIRIKGTVGVTVGEPCIGFEIDALFLALVFSSAGKLMNKLWFSIIGLTVLVFVNIARIMTLAYLVEINPWLWEMNHKFVFSIVVYSVLFFLWHLWIQKFSKVHCYK